jgi:hypothetical protein
MLMLTKRPWEQEKTQLRLFDASGRNTTRQRDSRDPA